MRGFLRWVHVSFDIRALDEDSVLGFEIIIPEAGHLRIMSTFDGAKDLLVKREESNTSDLALSPDLQEIEVPDSLVTICETFLTARQEIQDGCVALADSAK